tara:strand:- start:3046 stop:5301 length:2256 start_codon:yes stop_codon:yes gene_type:complete
MAFKGEELLKLILQLVRYDIPPLIVGKSSIGKSYTIIQLTEKWRLPSSLLYIGSEKPENIEGLAKLISKDYETVRGAGGEKITEGGDTLKFLKPYWFPNTNTISTQVANGEEIFNKYIKLYDSPLNKFSYTFDCLYGILIALMDVEFSGTETEIKASLVDRGNNTLSKAVQPVTLNKIPFNFIKGPETVIQAKTAYEYTLGAKDAGRNDARDMSMYLCTLLGFGNYWLILDELDKVGEQDKEKYAPLLHIVRERTLKDWTMKQINDKKGLNIPLSVKNEYYESVAGIISQQIKKGLPLLDCRVIGIANATKDIEEALFRRFAQVIMEDSMALYPPTNEENVIKNCVDTEVGEARMDITSLLTKLEFLDEVNLQWQYGFLPKILNQTDTLGNYFYEDWNKYVTNMAKSYPIVGGDDSSLLSAINQDEYKWEKTAWGKLWKDNFLGGKSDFESDEGLRSLFEGLIKLWVCLSKELYSGNTQSAPTMVGAKSTGGESKSRLMELRDIIAAQSQNYGKEYFNYLELELTKTYTETEGNAAVLSNWTNNTLEYIRAANEDAKGEYDTLGDIGEKMIPFIYGLILQLLRTDKLIDSDLFTSQFEIVNDFFVDFLNKDGQKGTHTLQANKEFTETLFYGGTQKTTKGKPERKLNEIAKRSLYGNTTENYYNSLSFSLYKRFYFMNEFYIFFEDTLNNNNSFIDYKKNIQNIKSAEYKEFNFLNSSEVKPILQGIYDAIPESDRNRRNVVNLKELFSLN